MISFDEVFLEKVVIHQVGNKVRDEGYQISEKLVTIDDNNLKLILEKYFLQLFVDRDTYSFHHDSDINLNEVYHFSKQTFEESSSFYNQSINIVKHLYNTSNHPNIKSGDFYMAFFTDGTKKVKIIGLFKAENKDTFLKVDESNGSFSFSYEKGLNLNKIDKGCLIIDEHFENDYKVMVIDSLAKTDKSIAKYWEIDFLNVRCNQNSDFQTKEVMKISDEFSKKILDAELKKEQKEIFNFKKKAYEYIIDNGKFVDSEFVEKVLPLEIDREKYIDFKSKYEDEHKLKPIENFEVSKKVLPKINKTIKSKIRLDTGIDIQVSNYDYLVEGYDTDKDMKFIKVYFNSKK